MRLLMSGGRARSLVIAERLGIAGRGAGCGSALSQAAHSGSRPRRGSVANAEAVGESKTSPTPTIDERGDVIRRTAGTVQVRAYDICAGRSERRRGTRDDSAQASPAALTDPGPPGFRACRCHALPPAAADLLVPASPSSMSTTARGTQPAPHRRSSNQCASRPADPLSPLYRFCLAAQAIFPTLRLGSSDPGFQGTAPLRSPRSPMGAPASPLVERPGAMGPRLAASGVWRLALPIPELTFPGRSTCSPGVIPPEEPPDPDPELRTRQG